MALGDALFICTPVHYLNLFDPAVTQHDILPVFHDTVPWLWNGAYSDWPPLDTMSRMSRWISIVLLVTRRHHQWAILRQVELGVILHDILPLYLSLDLYTSEMIVATRR